MYNSVHEKLFCLPDNCLVFPAHDYKGLTSSTIKEEKECNSRLNKVRYGILAFSSFYYFVDIFIYFFLLFFTFCNLYLGLCFFIEIEIFILRITWRVFSSWKTFISFFCYWLLQYLHILNSFFFYILLIFQYLFFLITEF